MGELLFWVGEDRIVFGSDYNIWAPKWQVEGFIDWQMPDDEQFSDYPKLTTATKKKILGLNAAKLYDIEVPAECQIPAPGTTADEDKAPGEELSSTPARPRGRRREGACELNRHSIGARVDERQRGGDMSAVLRDAVWAALGTVLDPELDEPITDLEFVVVVHRLRRRRRDGPAAAADLLLRAELLLPDGRRRLRRGLGGARGDPGGHRRWKTTSSPRRSTRGWRRGPGSSRPSPGEARAELDELRRTFNRKAALAGQDRVARPLVDAGAAPERAGASCGSARCPRRRT